MDTTREKLVVSVPSDTQSIPAPRQRVMPSRLTQLTAFAQSQIDLEDLVNTINYIHFVNKNISVHLLHPKHNQEILVRAYPDSCTGEDLTCYWHHDEISGLKISQYRFLHLVIQKGPAMVMVPAEPQSISKECLSVKLPKKSYLINRRGTRRLACTEVAAELTQEGFTAKGDLVDFSASAFRVRLRVARSASFNWMNPDAKVSIRLSREGDLLFAGDCRIIRQTAGLVEREMVLAPPCEPLKRFRKREIRSLRQKLVPAPTISFQHPLFRERVQVEIRDMSASGISIVENRSEGVLMPGLIIPEMTIHYAGVLDIRCKCQAVNRREEEDRFVSGLVILDMDIESYSKLHQILSVSQDPHFAVSLEVDMDALWEFLFDTNFIYPKKYKLIQSYKERFKETYRKLYQETPSIARHITYEHNGKIYGHISMVRAFERTWLMHHHAARPMETKLPGFRVLRQIGLFTWGGCHMPEARMDYLMCYYRPDNAFPERVFGGVARSLANPQACSLDLFSYKMFKIRSADADLPSEWCLEETSSSDIWELEQFYGTYSGGLLLKAFGFGLGKEAEGESLPETMHRLGFKRSWNSMALRCDDELKAVLVVNKSDLGINLSELLNSITIIVVDPEELSWDIISAAITKLAAEYDIDEIPLLTYPSAYLESIKVPFEKFYQFWVLNMSYADEYIQFTQKKFRMKYDQ